MEAWKANRNIALRKPKSSKMSIYSSKYLSSDLRTMIADGWMDKWND